MPGMVRPHPNVPQHQRHHPPGEFTFSTGIVSLNKFCYTITKYFLSYYRSKGLIKWITSWLIVCCLQTEDVRVVLFITQWAPTSVWETTRWSNISSLAKLINKWQWMNKWIILTICHINVYLYVFPQPVSCFFQWRQLHIDTQYWESQRVRHVIVLCLLFFCFYNDLKWQRFFL